MSAAEAKKGCASAKDTQDFVPVTKQAAGFLGDIADLTEGRDA